jgi:predicted DNA-binding transcriptional regulator YafY
MNTSDMTKGTRMARIIMHLINKRPRKFSAKELLEYLSDYEPVTLRNVQRDLKELVSISDTVIQQSNQGRTLLYHVEEDLAGTLGLSARNNRLLALFILKKLQPIFAPNAKTMSEMEEGLIDNLKDPAFDLFDELDTKLQDATGILGDRPALSMNNELLGDLLTALAERRILKVRYMTGEQDKTVEKILSPAKLILYQGQLYFICISEKHNYYVKLNRITSASLTSKRFEVTTERMKRINDWLSSSFGMLDDEGIKPQEVKLQFPSWLRMSLAERRFHHTQTVSTDKKGNSILSMHVPAGQALFQWVLSWGNDVTVLAPKKLKDQMREFGKKLVSQY